MNELNIKIIIWLNPLYMPIFFHILFWQQIQWVSLSFFRNVKFLFFTHVLKSCELISAHVLHPQIIRIAYYYNSTFCYTFNITIDIFANLNSKMWFWVTKLLYNLKYPSIRPSDRLSETVWWTWISRLLFEIDSCYLSWRFSLSKSI